MVSIPGSRTEFQNRFENPIKNGQCLDSTASDIKLMKARCALQAAACGLALKHSLSPTRRSRLGAGCMALRDC